VALVVEQAAVTAGLEARAAELERRLGQNSRNSSRPLSQDPLDAPPRSICRKTGRKSGKQPGAPGSALRLLEVADEVIDHEPIACQGCGGKLRGAGEAGVTRRQVGDIPEVALRVVEHRLHRRRCTCGAGTTADVPAGVNASAT
jgi:hypothetical protein